MWNGCRYLFRWCVKFMSRPTIKFYFRFSAVYFGIRNVKIGKYTPLVLRKNRLILLIKLQMLFEKYSLKLYYICPWRQIRKNLLWQCWIFLKNKLNYIALFQINTFAYEAVIFTMMFTIHKSLEPLDIESYSVSLSLWRHVCNKTVNGV